MPLTDSPTAALIVVNYGSSRLLAENLGRMELPSDVTVIIVDCFSNEGERAAVRELCARRGWDAVLPPSNLGFGGGMNAGALHAFDAGADVIVALNPDATIDAASLSTLVAASRDDPDAIISLRILDGRGNVWFDGADLYLDDGTNAGRRKREMFSGRPRREWANGACFAISADLWRRVGGFDDDYFLYWEDVDLSHRVLDAGGRIVLLEDATAVHDEGQTHGRKPTDRMKSETYYYYNIRNRLLYAAKHLDNDSLDRWTRSAWRVSYQKILLQGGKRQLIKWAPWRAYFRGLRDGYAMVKRLRG